MGFALAEARAAEAAGEVPVGAVVVSDGEIVGRGHNRPVGTFDPSAHAEIIALREAGARAGNYRLTGATLYATIEPCAMCAGAIVHARLGRLVYAAPDERAGGVVSIFQICTNRSLNHQVEVIGGIRAEEARELMKAFFRARRGESGSPRSPHSDQMITD
jgi:tRNA(adenine34) deaminase